MWKHKASGCCQRGGGMKLILSFSLKFMLFFSALKLKKEGNQVSRHHRVCGLNLHCESYLVRFTLFCGFVRDLLQPAGRCHCASLAVMTSLSFRCESIPCWSHTVAANIAENTKINFYRHPQQDSHLSHPTYSRPVSGDTVTPLKEIKFS